MYSWGLVVDNRAMILECGRPLMGRDKGGIEVRVMTFEVDVACIKKSLLVN
jgi:hypothetical protein